MITKVAMLSSIGSPFNLDVELPKGWYAVLSGAVKPGDMFLDAFLFTENGSVNWIDVDLGDLRKNPPKTSKYFMCLIRKGVPVEEQCPMCYEEAKLPRCKYCATCCAEVIKKSRKK
jgi:hypothetical protein